MSRSEEVDVLIIGAGPAGITAAIQLVRSGFNPLIIEKADIGGCLLNANWIDNYPPFASGISGSSLADKFFKHGQQYRINIRGDQVKYLHTRNHLFLAETESGVIQSKAVIIASGTSPRRINLPGEKELEGKLLFHELKTIPSPPPGKNCCIIGAGDGAFDYALSLAKKGVDCKILMRSSIPRALSTLREKVAAVDSINLLKNLTAIGFHTSKVAIDRLIIELDSYSDKTLACDFALIAVGRDPCINYIDKDLFERQNEYPLLQFAGDVVNGSYRQVGIAVGGGLKCAMNIAEKLRF